MNKEQGMSNIEGEVRSKNYFIIHTSPSIFDIPCSLFVILIKKLINLLQVLHQKPLRRLSRNFLEHPIESYRIGKAGLVSYGGEAIEIFGNDFFAGFIDAH